MAARDNPDADPADFRYPGPRPQSKETALVMLADSTEAVVRASQDHSQERIDALVEEVIAERVAEGQFDDCDITLRDLRVIAQSFKSSLRAIYHPRIEYPAATPGATGQTPIGAGPLGSSASVVPPDHIGGETSRSVEGDSSDGAGSGEAAPEVART